MAITIKITGSDETIRLTENSIVKFESDIQSVSANTYLEGCVNTIKLTGEVDLNLQRNETSSVMRLASWALLPSSSADCYREMHIKIYDSIGELMQTIHFEKCFIVEYSDKFHSKKDRTGYVVILRELKNIV